MNSRSAIWLDVRTAFFLVASAGALKFLDASDMSGLTRTSFTTIALKEDFFEPSWSVLCTGQGMLLSKASASPILRSALMWSRCRKHDLQAARCILRMLATC